MVFVRLLLTGEISVTVRRIHRLQVLDHTDRMNRKVASGSGKVVRRNRRWQQTARRTISKGGQKLERKLGQELQMRVRRRVRVRYLRIECED